MAYTPDPTDPTQPTLNQPAGDMAYELQAIKGYIQTLIVNGRGFSYSGSLRNRLKNGSFRITQRGSGPFVVNSIAYTLDQWQVTSVGSNATVVQGTGPVTGIGFVETISITTLSGNTGILLSTRIESIDTQDMIVGTPVTISGWYYTSSTSFIPAFNIQTPTISNDNYTSGVVNASGGPLVTLIPPFVANSWTYFSSTVILTASCNGGMQINLSVPNPGSAVFNFTNIQVEKGSLATPFEQRPYSYDFTACQRYYQTGSSQGAGYFLSGANGQMSVQYATMMRASPTITTDFTGMQWGSPTVSKPAAPFDLTSFIVTGTIAATGGYNYKVAYTATAEL